MENLRAAAKVYVDSEKKYGKDRKLYHYNCAESLFNAGNDYYKLNVKQDMLNIMSAFGGGMYSAKACGLLTAGIAVIGLLFTEEKPSLNEKMKNVAQDWVNVFQKEFGHTECHFLKEKYKDPDLGAEIFILKAADLLEQVIAKYL